MFEHNEPRELENSMNSVQLSHGQLLRLIANAIEESFDESDWKDFGCEFDVYGLVNSHSRLLRSMSFGDSDYRSSIYDIIAQLSPDVLPRVLQFEPIKASIVKNSPHAQALYQGLSSFIESTVSSPIDLLGTGGFGRVEAVKLNDGITLARKSFVYTGEDEEDTSKALERFRREVTIQIELAEKHPEAVLPILLTALESRPPSFYMPLAQKQFREQITNWKIEASSPGDLVDTALGPTLEIFQATRSLHSLGFVHRDLKPENILYWAGRWLLADFGMCLDPSRTRLTSSNVGIGTNYYQAPEALTNARYVTTASDIFSLGCILNDIFANGNRIPHRMATGPGQIGKVIETCTRDNPAERFKDVKDLIEAFNWAADKDSVGA